MSELPPPPFVAPGFVPPAPPVHRSFRLVPLGPQHNASDHAAWSSSIDHIRATPGFDGRGWPHPMTLAENLADLERHAADFSAGTGFTYTVLGPEESTVIGCVYIYPSEDPAADVVVRSWVREADAALDPVLHDVVRDWLAASWPFARVAYASRS